VRSFLDVLSQRAGTVLALGTGNLEQSARMKLAAHGLDRYFETGGFGEDGIERDALIAAGIARAQSRYRMGFARVVVIGDTPADVACARANRVHSLGVATGPCDVQALRQAGATLVYADLSRTPTIVEALDALPPTSHLTATPG
jgi:phosphoglycolate phosphatase-like HAD superfamily hydrolase